MSTIKCPHCSGDVPITKQVQKVVMRFFARKPRPGGGNAGNGERRREICRKAAAASVLKRWGKVVGVDPTQKQLHDQEMAEKRAQVGAVVAPTDPVVPAAG